MSEEVKWLVEKVTKGVRKQLKGYVNQTIEQIEAAISRSHAIVRRFEESLERTKHLRADMVAFEEMADMTRQNQKLMIEMKTLYTELRNKVVDIRLLEIQIQQYLEIHKKRDEQNDPR